MPNTVPSTGDTAKDDQLANGSGIGDLKSTVLQQRVLRVVSSVVGMEERHIHTFWGSGWRYNIQEIF